GRPPWDGRRSSILAARRDDDVVGFALAVEQDDRDDLGRRVDAELLAPLLHRRLDPVGERPIAALEPPDLLAALGAGRDQGADVGHRGRDLVVFVFHYPALQRAFTNSRDPHPVPSPCRSGQSHLKTLTIVQDEAMPLAPPPLEKGGIGGLRPPFL